MTAKAEVCCQKGGKGIKWDGPKEGAPEVPSATPEMRDAQSPCVCVKARGVGCGRLCNRHCSMEVSPSHFHKTWLKPLALIPTTLMEAKAVAWKDDITMVLSGANPVL